MIKIKNLKLYYDNITLISNLNVEISTPGIYSIIGRSGCGKTSLLRALINQNDSYTGDILYGEENIKNISNFDLFMRNYIFYADSDLNFFPHNSVLENIMLLCDKKELLSLPKYEERYSLKDLYHKKIMQLSLGEKQRVLIVIMLLKNKKINYIDEILCNLDEKFLTVVKEDILNFSHNNIVILVSHKLEDVEEISTKILPFENDIDYKNIGEFKLDINKPVHAFASKKVKTSFHLIPVFYFTFLSFLLLLFMVSLTIVSTSTRKSAENILLKESTLFDNNTKFEVDSGYQSIRIFKETYKDFNKKEYDIYNTFVFTNQVKIDGEVYHLKKQEIIVPKNYLYQSFIEDDSNSGILNVNKLGIGILGYLDSSLKIKHAYDVVNTMPMTDYLAFLDENVIYMTLETMNDIVFCNSIPTLMNLTPTKNIIKDYYGNYHFNESILSYQTFLNYPTKEAQSVSNIFDKDFRILTLRDATPICIPYDKVEPLSNNEIYLSNSLIQYLNYLNKTYSQEEIFDKTGVWINIDEIIDTKDTGPLKPISIYGTLQELANQYVGKEFKIFLSTKDKFTEVTFKVKGIIVDKFNTENQYQAINKQSHSIISDEYYQEIAEALNYDGILSYTESFYAYNLQDNKINSALAKRLIEVDNPNDYMTKSFYQYLELNQNYRLASYFITPVTFILCICILYFLNKIIALQNKENIQIMKEKGYLNKEIISYKNQILYKIILPLIIIVEFAYFLIFYLLRNYMRFYFYPIGFEWIVPLSIVIYIFIKHYLEMKKNNYK